MATHDYVIANGTGASVRSDLNNALAAIVSNNSSATEPTTTYAYMWWADTTAGQLKLRNAADNAWVTIQELDGTMLMEDGTAGAPGLAFASDLDTGFYRPAANELGIATGGTGRLFVDSSGNVGVGGTPSQALDVVGSIEFGSSSNGLITEDGTQIIFRANNSGRQAHIMTHDGAEDINLDPSGFIQFECAGSERMRLDSSGRLLVGTSSAATGDLVQILQSDGGSLGLRSDTATGTIGTDAGLGQIRFMDSSGDIYASIQGKTDGTSGSGDFPGKLVFSTTADGASSPTERMRIDNSGRLLVGTSSARTVFGTTSPKLLVESVSDTDRFAQFAANRDTANGFGLYLLKSRGTTNGSNTVVQSGDSLGFIAFQGTDGSNRQVAARIDAEVDGTPGTNDMPGRLVFSTTADGASSPTERMRITSTGHLFLGQSTTDTPGFGNTTSGMALRSFGDILLSRPSAAVLYLSRNADDGSIVSLRQDGTEEGTISVSGTTVSYNGAHLSRWSQLPGGAERTEILRGTVLSNIDEMCAWGNEDNEQLNRMKVSDVEGDPNVSGVFQAWDDDDDTYTDDFYCAMTGDFIIRIAEGVTVQRGDLLMSAGDGTAKPQDDDIIRSKTIAKVTSTHVTCTYDDGSYCVPCVLMAC